MPSASHGRPVCRRSRIRRLWAGAVCAASFVAGQAVFGGPPAPVVLPAEVNALRAQPAATAAGEPAPVQVAARPLPAAGQSAAPDKLPPIVPAANRLRPSGGAQSSAAQTSSTQTSTAPQSALPIPRVADPMSGAPVAMPRPATVSAASAGTPRPAVSPARPIAGLPQPVVNAPQAAVSRAEPVFIAQPAPLPAGPALGKLPPGSPFEVIDEAGPVSLRVGRSLLMRTKVDIYRTAIVDESVCDVVQFTPREISLIGRAQGTTHVTFWFDDPNTPPLTYLVTVEPDPKAVAIVQQKYQMLEDLINEMFPDSKIRLVVLADKLLVKGQAKDAEEAAQIMTVIRAQYGGRGGAGGGYGFGGGMMGTVGDAAATGVLPGEATGRTNQSSYRLINMLRVPGVQQVALKVKIAELNRTAARGFGVNVAANIDLVNATRGTQLVLASLLNPASSTAIIGTVENDDLILGIRYLQQHGVARLLSEPTLVTLSGRPATFVAGGEFAVPTVVGSVGLNAVTTDFRAFGAIISFLPTVIDKDYIRLQVAPEFSQINSGLSVGGTPGLNVRSATTTVEMREGQTLAIAGLIEDNYKADQVANLPFLGHIFGNRNGTRNETELIILVTPELVHPMDPEEVPPLPGFDVTEPNASEFFLHGQLEGMPTRTHRTTVWPQLRKRYGAGGPAMTSGPFGHGQ